MRLSTPFDVISKPRAFSSAARDPAWIGNGQSAPALQLAPIGVRDDFCQFCVLEPVAACTLRSSRDILSAAIKAGVGLTFHASRYRPINVRVGTGERFRAAGVSGVCVSATRLLRQEGPSLPGDGLRAS